MRRFFARSWHEAEGADSAEYALMFTLICVVVIAVLQIMGTTLKTSYANASSTMDIASGHGPAAASGSAGQPASGGGSSPGSGSGSPGEPVSGGGSGSNGGSSSGGASTSGGGNGNGGGHGHGWHGHGGGYGHGASGGGGGNGSGTTNGHTYGRGWLNGKHKT